MKKKKGIFGKIIIGIVVLAVIGAVFGGKDENDEAPQSEPVTKVEAAAETNDSTQEVAIEATQSTESAEENSATEQPEQQSDSSSEIRPELKEFLDSYEAFMDEYCEFMESYNASDFTQLAKYTQLLTRYADFAEKASSWEGEDLNDSEVLYYTEVLNRVSQRLVKTGLEMQ